MSEGRVSEYTHTAQTEIAHECVCVYLRSMHASAHKNIRSPKSHTRTKCSYKKKNAHSSTSMRFFHSALWGHCVLCVNVSGIYLLGGGIKVSGGGGSVRACVLVVAMVCVCACACAGGDDACARVRAFVCSCWR